MNGAALRAMLRDGLFRVATIAVVAALAVLGVAVTGAVRVAPVAAALPPASVADSALRFPLAGAGTDIAAAVAADVFSEYRQAPRRRYLLPGAADEARAPAPRPVVLGTAISGDGASFATCQIPGGPPTIVRVGATIGGYVVVAIERGRVTFRSAGGERFSIDASKPAP